MRGASGDDPDPTDDPESTDDPEPTDNAESDPATGSADSDEEFQWAGSESTDAEAGGADGGRGTADETGDSAATGTAEVDAAAIDPSELTVSERSLHPRIRTLWIVRAMLWGLVLGAIATAATWQWLDVSLLLPVAITVVLVVLFVAHAVLRYRAWQYEFREDAIYLERGVLTRVRTVVPFVRIQHVDTARGPIDRLAGLSTLVVYTAGSRGADVTIPGIDADRATEHQRRLKQLAIAAEDDTAV